MQPETLLGMKLVALAIRTLCDVRAKTTADGVFLCSQTRDNQRSVLAAGQQLIHAGLARKVLVVDSEPKSGYPGYAVWEKELLGMGIPREIIAGVDLRQAASLNTLIEATAMIAHAKENNYRDMYIAAAPFQQLRAFMTSVTVALTHYPDIRLYSFNGHPLSWMETVVHSQGTTLGLRKDLIRGELERIEKYQQKGDLAKETAVWDYLDQRDRLR
jgi:hypothetical protein